MTTDRDDKIEATGTAAPPSTAEGLAKLFHESIRVLAPEHGYSTEDFGPWSDVPEKNRNLAVAAMGRVMDLLVSVSQDQEGEPTSGE